MKRFATKMLAVIITLAMMTACIPFTAFAAYENTHVNTGDMAADLVAVAATQVGYLEGSLAGTTAGSNNYQKYGQWYDNNVDYIGVTRAAWCAAFVSWCANQAGIPSDIVYYHAYCPYGVNWFKNQGRFQYSASRGGSYVPKAGDIIYFAPAGSTVSSHIGIVRACYGGYVYTTEGNTSGQNGEVNEGGGVFNKSYALSYSRIMGYGVPAYENSGSSAEKLGTYKVTASSLNVRSSTDSSSDANIVGVLQSGAITTVNELSGDWGKVTLADGTEGWTAIAGSYGDYIGIDVLNNTLTPAWGDVAIKTNSDGSVTFTNSTAEPVAVDMPTLVPIGTTTTPYLNISVSLHSGGWYFGLTQAGSGYFMMRECTSGDQLVVSNTATYMATDEQLQICVKDWWKPEEGYKIDTIRMYLNANSSITCNYAYFADAADVVTSTAYNTRSNAAITLMDPDKLSIVDTTKSGSYQYNNGKLTVTSDSADGLSVTFALNQEVNVSLLKNLLVDVSSDVRFDVSILATTSVDDRAFGLVSDFWPGLCEAKDGEYLPAGDYYTALDFNSCYTWNDVLPTGGISTIRNVTVTLGGAGTLTLDALQLAPSATFASFSDGVVKEGASDQPTLPGVLGDVNNDGGITTADARLILQYVVGGAQFSLTQKALGDYDGDGGVSTSDARAILKHTVTTV